MSNYFRCDVCGRETYGCNIVNGMKFCAKCYHQIFGKDNQQNEIQQLKQQLAEKDKEIERLNTIIGLSQLQVSEKDRLNTSVNINSLQYNQTQLAITELEKVKNFIDGRTYCADYINKRIQELKGE